MTVFDKSRLKHLSTRELQAYGAACLATFCANKGISSPYVDALIAHLLSVLTCSDLPGWETAGARLELTGRGDPLPPGLLASLRSDMLPILQHLVDSVVEIGLVDMYTAETERPFEFLLRTTTILELQGVHPPSIG